ncbi:LysR family transcriptional regulator [Paraburkholderia sp. CI3]|uniref:LysR family transcriptional regulator n=1 Tax=Paraburkholderia sp. CI3 TaxID=2991060 RepID=UPI003D21512E
MADLNSLAIFAKVVEAKGFSEAARRLNIPLSTVSRRVADLEDQLGVRLLERSTRSLRLTDIGAEVLEHAQRCAEHGETIDNLVSNQSSTVAGVLRLSAPMSTSDTLVAPLLRAFQVRYPNIRAHVFITNRYVDPIADGVDLAFRVGPLSDSSLVARKIFSFRHRLVASPAYLEKVKAPSAPSDLLDHKLLAFSHWAPSINWTLLHRNGEDQETLSFEPHLSMNDYSGLAAALLGGAGIGDLPQLVQPDLIRGGRLVEVMPEWHLPTMDLSLVHLGNRHISRPVRLFKEFALESAPTLFPDHLG